MCHGTKVRIKNRISKKTLTGHLCVGVPGKIDVSGKAASAGDLLCLGAGRRRPVSK